jgi:hypothetical protein
VALPKEVDFMNLDEGCHAHATNTEGEIIDSGRCYEVPWQGIAVCNRYCLEVSQRSDGEFIRQEES